ncbi:MAG: hypothetical protein ACI9LM_003077 [Alteromonadaceae bacterium]|jgi:hypothetical protein
MFSTLFKSEPVVDTGTRDWIFDSYAWAIENFDLTVFKNDSQLILPTNQFYPGSVSSVHQMAEFVFEHTLKYAGMDAWPIRLVEPHLLTQTPLPLLKVSDNLRGHSVDITVENEQVQMIDISYNPAQVNQPQDLVSSFAQVLATILVLQSKTLPPGGKEFIPQAIDLVACFMGFGVIFANTAYQFKGGCGSCNNRSANRQASLPEQETVYALAVFCVLKSIPVKTVQSHLKAHLKSSFKKAVKEVEKYVQKSEHPALLIALS